MDINIRDLLIERLEEKGLNTRDFKDILDMIKQPKYGLVWENHPEYIEEYLKNNSLVLHEEKKLRIDSGYGYTNNTLIEGDNLASLLVLREMGKKVDVIYIDPPYNTGNEFVYNDKIVDKEDSFKHSKWLSFMEKRLKVARDLLTDEGVIFVSIDDNEQANLKLLMDKVFGEENFVKQLIWFNNKKGRQTDKKIAGQHEYVLVYAKGITGLNISMCEINDESVTREYNKYDSISKYKRGVELTNTNSKFNINTRPNLFYSVYYNELTNDVELRDEKIKNVNGFYVDDADELLIKKGYVRILPRYRSLKGFGCFRWGMKKFQNEYKTELLFEKNKFGEFNIYTKARLSDDGVKYEKYRSVIDITGTGVGNKLEQILGEKLFDFPKPVEFIKHLTKMHPNKNAKILDFFAGSGTTGHAVLELNKEDGGHRQFILCTNNENNICRDVTYKRLRRVVNGYTTPKGKKVEGLPANLTYLTFSETPTK